MQNRRDHVQAHRFAVGRLVSALLSGDPGPVEVPMRRGNLGFQFGALVAALLAAGFGVYGLISPKESTAWRSPGAIIVEKETGNRYVYLDQRLYPMANYASALLIAGSRSQTVSVARETLADVRRGPQLGILGAPDDVPPAAELLSGDRAVCLPPGSEKTLVDLDPAGRSTPVPRGRWILLSGPDNTTYILWNGRTFKLPSHAELVALGLVSQQPITVSKLWLAQVRSGGTLTALRIPEEGSEGPSVAGRAAKVGQLFQATAAGFQELYVLLSDGLAPVNRTEFALLSGVPGAAAPRQVTAGDIAEGPVSKDRSLLTAMPDLLSGSAFAPGSSALCVLQKAGSSKGGSIVTEPVAGSLPSGVFVPPTKGLLVAARPAQKTNATPRLYLITDSGKKYPLADSDALAAIGYGQAKVRTLPRQLLDLAPTGPVLDITAAKAAVAARAGKGP
ncbi:type VII secretion protein EccB [Streptomyces chartreusis]|uniref:Type VII secretion protein EccB n=1 Tax=Streptomyces chartreusis TaxID=1969 RepID=A0A7I0Y8Y8_STRCX|nr:type VII secretion protein EccB [Streptomyces chartreusis]QKZ15969.1 type VII secretion protein EccB [Streptomyces chartreusis]